MKAALHGPAAVRRGALIVIITALFTLLTAAGMSAYAGAAPKPYTHPNSAGFTSAILWFELVRTPEEAFQVLGPKDSLAGQALRHHLDRLNQADFIFLIAYPSLMAALFVMVHILHLNKAPSPFASPRFVNFGIVLTPLMMLGDAGENVQLLQLSAAGDPSAVGSWVLPLLIGFTSVKWSAIFVGAIALGAAFAAYFGPRVGLLGSLLYASCGAIGLMSLFVPGARWLLQVATLLLGAAWLFSMVHAIAILARKPRHDMA